MPVGKFLDAIRDPYEREARMYPALLVVLPILVLLLGHYGADSRLLKGLLLLVCSCGVIYALANVARGLGKRCEERLVEKWGGMPTTIALRHRDNFFDSVTKRRYHDAIARGTGIALPSPDAEAKDPRAADDSYVAATRRVRELTRGDNKAFALLRKENAAYGFHRNMLGVRWIGIAAALIALIYESFSSRVFAFAPPYFDVAALTNLGAFTYVTLTVCLILLLAWLMYFTDSSVRRIGFSYAERLFECAASLPESAQRVLPKRSARSQRKE
jgi:hypothetical protein